jgi:hypothetical protein
MRKLAVILVAAVVTGLVVGIVISGSDGDSSEEVPVPELRAPGDSSATGPEDGTGGDEGAGGGSGAPAPDQDPEGGQQDSGQGGTGGAQPPPDTEQNDVPPPAGSPAEQAERFCEQNPGAC